MKLHLKPISKRLFSLLLAVVLVLGLPSQAMAATNVGSSETTATQPTDATEPVSTEASDPTEPAETLEATEPAATEETESEPTDTPTTPDVTEPEATETPTEPTEPTEPLTPEEQDMIRWAELEAQLPDPIEEYFPFAPEIKYPYGEPQDNFYPSSLFEADPYALMPLADMSAIPDNMYDNSILRALAYTGYDVQWLKDNGFLYVAEYVSSNINSYRPEVLSDIGYDDYAPFLNGDETVADSSTATGRAPDIASFESSGLVCASFVSYYINNYLPNIEGYDTSHIHEAIKATTSTGTGYSTASVWSWETGLTNLANTPGSGVTKYTNETEGYANLVPGDIIVFSRDGELVHVAIYAGTYSMWNIRGTNRGEKHFIIHVGNSRGPEISTTEYLAKSGTAKSSVATAWYHLELGSVVDQVGFIEVYKKDPNGNNLSGARFKAVDQDTGDTFYIGPTDANGYAKSGEMPLGTYVVTETVFPDGYQASGQTSWTVTLTGDTPNMTVTINAVNEPVTGSAKIVKATTNGGSKAGWHFEVKNSSGTVIGNYVTDATGVIALDLEPGTYTVTETDGAYKYWVNDPNPTRTVTVKANETATMPPFDILPLFSAGRSRRLTLVPIIQSLAQLEKNYGKEGSEIMCDNCQDTIFGGFAPNSQTANTLSGNLGSRTVLSGTVTKGKNDDSQSLQMMERPLMSADELKSMPKGSFVVMKTGTHPMKTKLKLFFEWGIQFEKPLEMPDRGSRPVYYAGKQDLERSILSQFPTIHMPMGATMPSRVQQASKPMPESTSIKTSTE